MSGSREGYWPLEGGEPVAVGHGMSGRTRTSQTWDMVPQLPRRESRAGPVMRTRVRHSPGEARQARRCKWAGGSQTLSLVTSPLQQSWFPPPIAQSWERRLQNLSFSLRVHIALLHSCQKELEN